MVGTVEQPSFERIEIEIEGVKHRLAGAAVPRLHRRALVPDAASALDPTALAQQLVAGLEPLGVEGVMFWDPSIEDVYALANLDDEVEAAKLARGVKGLVEGMLPVYRTLAQHGLTTIMHAELGPAAWMFRSASAELCQELDGLDSEARKRTRWILRRLVSFVGLQRDAAQSRLLSRQVRAARPWREEALELFAA